MKKLTTEDTEGTEKYEERESFFVNIVMLQVMNYWHNCPGMF